MIATEPIIILDKTYNSNHLSADKKHENNEGVFFFDIDNCLYSTPSDMKELLRSKNIEYCSNIAGIPEDRVIELAKEYCDKYYLSVRGLKIHHDVDIVDFDEKVDQSVPLEKFIKPNPELRRMLLKIKVKRWAFTNSYYPYASRVLELLGISDLFHGITYCDFKQLDFPCKPEPEAYHKAMREAQVTNPDHCFFLDDSIRNLDQASKLGWTTIHLNAKPDTDTPTTHRVVSKAEDLPSIFPEMFEE